MSFGSRNHFKQLSSHRYRLHHEHSVSSQCSSESTDSYKKSSSGDTEPGNKSFQSGLRRSHAFHTAELLQQQVGEKEGTTLQFTTPFALQCKFNFCNSVKVLHA